MKYPKPVGIHDMYRTDQGVHALHLRLLPSLACLFVHPARALKVQLQPVDRCR